MSATMTQTVVAISVTDLEDLVRRVVREVVHEELTRLPRTAALSMLNDWSQEGPDDPAGDAQLLHEALAVLEEYGDKPETWTEWQDFEAELDRAEANDELPD